MKKLFLLFTICLATTAFTQTAIINPSQDNSIFSEGTNSNALGKLYSGTNGAGNFRRALIQFDIAAAIPAGATITGVSLDLAVDQVGAGAGADNYSIHPVTTAWGEGTSNGMGAGAPATPTDATWVDAMFGATIWTAAGGDFGPASATTALPPATGTYTWNAATMITDVQNWLDTPGSNFGWALIGNEILIQSARRFGSKEQGTTPVLTVTYTAACTTPPNALCQNVTAYLDGTGNAAILDADLDNGSTLVCGTSLSFSASQTTFTCGDIATGPTPTSLVISAAYDATLTGGLPKGVELYVINDIPDLSIYGLGSANNGLGTDGVEFTFPSVSASAGDYIYVASEATGFTTWFGFAPDYTSGSMLVNGDDAIELFENAAVIDVFGDINVDGTGQPWEYLDGWAYRNNSTGPDGSTFTIGNWTFSGPDALDGETDNATAATPIPIGTYTTPSTQPGVNVILTVTDDLTNSSTCSAVVVVLDTLPPTVACMGTFTLALDGTGNGTLTTGDIDNGSTDNCGIASMSLSQTAFTCADIGTQQVTLYVTDDNGLMDSCTAAVTVDGSAAVTISNIATTDPSCFGFCDGSITITATGAVNYSIDNGASYQATNTYNALCGGNYDVLVNNGAGCEVSTSVSLLEPTEVLMTVENDTVCAGATGTLTLIAAGGTAPHTYDLNGTTQATGVFSGLAIGGPYTATVIDANGCTSVSENKFVIEAPAINIAVDFVGCIYTCQQNNATYQWINCDDTTDIVGATSQSYDLANHTSSASMIACVITDAYGCSDTTDCYGTEFVSLNVLNGVDVSIYPNPTASLINIALIGNAEVVRVVLRDVNGKEILSDEFSNAAFEIDASALDNGTYIIELISDDAKITERVLVQH